MGNIRKIVKESFDYAMSVLPSAEYANRIKSDYYSEEIVRSTIKFDLLEVMLKCCLSKINVRGHSVYTDVSEYMNDIIMCLQGRVNASVQVSLGHNSMKIDMLQYAFVPTATESNCYLAMTLHLQVSLNAPAQEVADLMLAMDSIGIQDEVIDSILQTSFNLSKVEEVTVTTAKKLLEDVAMPSGIVLDFKLKGKSSDRLSVRVLKKGGFMEVIHKFETSLPTIKEDLEKNLKLIEDFS